MTKLGVTASAVTGGSYSFRAISPVGYALVSASEGLVVGALARSRDEAAVRITILQALVEQRGRAAGREARSDVVVLRCIATPFPGIRALTRRARGPDGRRLACAGVCSEVQKRVHTCGVSYL